MSNVYTLLYHIIYLYKCIYCNDVLETSSEEISANTHMTLTLDLIVLLIL